MTETLVYGYSSENTQQDLSNEYQHDQVSNLSCVVPERFRTVGSALAGSMIIDIE